MYKFTKDHTLPTYFQAIKRASFVKINQLITFTNSKV